MLEMTKKYEQLLKKQAKVLNKLKKINKKLGPNWPLKSNQVENFSIKEMEC